MDTELLHAPLYLPGVEKNTRPAFTHGADTLDYASLSRAAKAGSTLLIREGCKPGDRIAIALPKNLLATRAIFSTLAAGAVVVPIDPFAPPARILSILSDAEPHKLMTTTRVASALLDSASSNLPPITCLDNPAAWDELVQDLAFFETPAPVTPDAPAVFYYTSGTTGKPKAIVLSHRNISSFANWAIEHLGLNAEDRFASHAPLHFDLTTLDLYAGTKLGASTLLLDDVTVKFPAKISQLLEAHATTIWYSVPTALDLLVRYGALDRRNLEKLRMILFAGESFPIPALRKLMAALPGRAYINLYGPTETNVCTYHRVADPLPADILSLPIGIPCEHLQVALLKEDGTQAAMGEEGEITVTGSAVMTEYRNNPQLTEATHWQGKANSYRTGDYGRMDAEGNIHLLGRRDELVKVRGYRIELQEIAAILNQHPSVREASVFLSSTESRLIAAVSLRSGGNDANLDILEHCKRWLPAYAVPDDIQILPDMPRTSTGKIDKQSLKQHYEQGMP